MIELYQIFDSCARDEARFLDKVIPFRLPCAKIKPFDPPKNTEFWMQRAQELEEAVQRTGTRLDTQTFEMARLAQEISRHVSHMIGLIRDRMIPENLDEMAKSPFAALLPLLGLESDAPKLIGNHDSGAQPD